MTERRYLPTIADLIDRLSICLMKSIFIDRDAYRAEMELIRHDILLAWQAATSFAHNPADLIYAIQVNMLANRYIWENEAWVRRGGEVNYEMRDVADCLKATHSINGVRNRAKNEINKIFGERVDRKIDCLAADLPKEFGNWQLWDD